MVTTCTYLLNSLSNDTAVKFPTGMMKSLNVKMSQKNIRNEPSILIKLLFGIRQVSCHLRVSLNFFPILPGILYSLLGTKAIQQHQL